MSPGPIPVTDLLSNWNDQITTAARIVRRSKDRQAVFEAIYRGNKQLKTVHEVMKITGLSQVRVLQEGAKLDGLLVIKVPNGYRKKKEFSTRYKQILSLARNKERLDRVPTKTSPKGTRTVTVTFPRRGQDARFISVDDIDSFKDVRNVTANSAKPMKEEKLKKAFQNIIGEAGSFKDWGGERSDLFSTRLRIHGHRVPAAVAFKGKATKGKLVPGKMGKNGDQINRLFTEPAEVFLVVYPGPIDSSIISQMRAFAIGTALSGKRVSYGVVDGADIGRLQVAYPNFFKK